MVLVKTFRNDSWESDQTFVPDPNHNWGKEQAVAHGWGVPDKTIRDRVADFYAADPAEQGDAERQENVVKAATDYAKEVRRELARLNVEILEREKRRGQLGDELRSSIETLRRLQEEIESDTPQPKDDRPSSFDDDFTGPSRESSGIRSIASDDFEPRRSN